MKKSRLAHHLGKRLLSSILVTTMLLGGITATDIYYNYTKDTIYAASLTGTSATVSTPAFNVVNLPNRDTSGTVSYWYAGNEFHALNQITDGVKQADSGTSGHVSLGSYVIETTANGQIAVKGNLSGGSDFDTYTKEDTNPTSDTVWELMDTDAVWDDQYLYAQYYTYGFTTVQSSFAPTILQTVESWYDDGFSYDGSKNSRATISASGKSWFSDAEKNAVKSATVKTDGVNGASNTITTDTLSDAHLFAASVDEIYYNPVQVSEVIANLAADKSAYHNDSSYQYARSRLWSRSFWGVGSSSYRNGFVVYSSGQLYLSSVASEFGVAPAFYLDLSKVVMARSASNAAVTAAATGLKAYDASTIDTTNGIKFLLQDSDFASGFTSSINNKMGIATIGSTYSIDYSGASTSTVNDAGDGSKLVISAALYDQSGKIAYYGPLAEVSSASGNVSVTIPSGMTEGTYTLALFEEQLGGISTYNTGNNTNNNNGSTFTGKTYTAYESDYQSGSVALMSLSLVNDYHTGVTFANNNSTTIASGNTVSAQLVSGTFTSYNNTLNGTVAADDIYVIAASDWEGNQSVTNSNLAKSITVTDGSNGTYTYYAVVKDMSVNPGYFEKKYSVNVDYHTGVVVENKNETNISFGDTLAVEAISGTFTSLNDTLNDNILADNVYIIPASDWEGKESSTNSALVKSIVIPDDVNGTYDYYVIVKDETVEQGYFAVKYTVDVSENATGFDAETWYTYKDSGTDITWNYKLNGNGDIIGLYTKDSIVKLVDGGGTLNIPAKVSGRTVVKVGGGSENTPVVPASETAYTSISLPTTVTTINDFAFYGSKAEAQITIPSHVTAIGIKAFYDSSVTGVKISEMNGTIGSYAFGRTSKLGTVSIKGGNSGLTLSTVAFADSSVTEVSIYGNVTVNKQAFRNDISLKSVNISGNVKINEYAFTNCTNVATVTINGTTDIGSYAFNKCASVTMLKMSGTTNIASYAFNGLTSLESLYIPAGTTVAPYAFNGCAALEKLETEVSIPSNAFADCGAVKILILDENVESISYDWEGHTSSVEKRTVYVKNKDMQIEVYGKEDIFYSPFGSSGNITVYVPNDSSVDMGANQVTDEYGILKLNGYTCYAHSGVDVYGKYIKGIASNVTLKAINNLDTQIESEGDEIEKNTESEKEQTGIDAYYTGTILTTTDINKDNMTVVRMFGSDEGEAYTSAEFYVVRTTEFNAEARKTEGVQENAIAAYEPVHALDSDLDNGSTTGTISVTVVVFYDVMDAESNVIGRKYYSAPVSIRVEEYTSKSYIEQAYGSYDAIAERLVELDNQIAELQAQLDSADVKSVSELTKELNGYKAAYAELVDTLEKYVSDNSSSNGYFGTSTDEATGEKSDVIFIEGNPTDYTDSGKKDADGNVIYDVSYDTDGDGTPEDIYVVVKDDGIHVVDAEGNKITGTDGKDIVYKDTLGALERQAAAQLAEIKSQLAEAEQGIEKIKKAVQDAGYDIDTSDGADDDVTQIVDAISDMSDKINSLNNDLENANSLIGSYSAALNTIYNKLTNSTLEADKISGLANVLNAIVGKIQSLQNDLTVAQATVTDLRAQLNNAENKVSLLQSELETTKSELSKAETDLTQAKKDKADLQVQYEAAIASGDQEAAAKLKEQIDAKNAAILELETTKENLAQKEQDLKDAQDTVKQLQAQIDAKDTEILDLQNRLNALSSSADGFKMTVDTANALFGLSLAEGASDADVLAAIQDYVKTKLDTDQTIAAIQLLVNSTNTGNALVADVESAINLGSANVEDGNDVVNKDSASYKAGYEEGVASVDASASYDEGYNAGYTEGIASVDTSAGYNEGYNAGYADGNSKNDESTSSTQIKNLTAQIKSLTDENTTLSAKVTTANAENASLKSEVSTLTSANKALTSKVNTLTKNVSTLTEENGNLSSQISTLKTQVTSLSSQITSLKNNSTTSNTSNTATTTAPTTTAPTTTAPTTTAPTTTAPTATASAGSNSTNAGAQSSTKSGNASASSSTSSSATVTSNQTPSTTTGVASTETENAQVVKNSTLVTVDDSAMTEISLPTDSESNEVAATQQASTELVKLNSNANIEIVTNAESYTETTSSQKDNAYRILTYYLNHLEELGEIGSDELSDAANDELKNVSFEVVTSIDVEAGEEQLEAMENGESADLTISSDVIEAGQLYVVIHESEIREGIYDVLLVTAEDNSISMELPDFSPVTIAKVAIEDVERQSEEVIEETETEYPELLAQAISAEDETVQSNSAFRNVMYVLIVISLVGLAAVLVLMKKQKDGTLPHRKK